MDRKSIPQDSSHYLPPRALADLPLRGLEGLKTDGVRYSSDFCSASSLGSDALVSYYSPVWDSYSTLSVN